MPVKQNPDKVQRVAEKMYRFLQEEVEDDWDAVGIVLIVAEVRDYPERTLGVDGISDFVVFCSDGRTWVQSAVLEEAKAVVYERHVGLLDDPEDE